MIKYYLAIILVATLLLGACGNRDKDKDAIKPYDTFTKSHVSLESALLLKDSSSKQDGARLGNVKTACMPLQCIAKGKKGDNGRKPIFKRQRVAFFLEKGTKVKARAKEGSTPLHDTVVNGSSKEAKILLAHNADMDAAANNGETPLHAARYGRLAVAVVLLKKDANVEARDTAGRTPLHWAARYGRLAVAMVLLKKGANGEA